MKKTIYRSAITGRLVTKEFAEENPDTTVKETVDDTLNEIKSIVESDLTDSEKIERIKELL